MTSILTQIDLVDTQEAETLSACLQTVLGRTVCTERGITLDVTKLGGKEDLVTLPGSLEPLPEECFVIAVHTRPRQSTPLDEPSSHPGRTSCTYSALSQNVAPNSTARSRKAKRSSSDGVAP
jgi:hypothetical protein